MKGCRKLRVGETITRGDINKWGFEAGISLGDAVSKGEIWYRPIKRKRKGKARPKVLKVLVDNLEQELNLLSVRVQYATGSLAFPQPVWEVMKQLKQEIKRVAIVEAP